MNRLGGDDISDPGAIPLRGIAPGYKATFILLPPASCYGRHSIMDNVAPIATDSF